MKKSLIVSLLLLGSLPIIAQQNDLAERPGKYFWQAGVAFGATFTENNPTAVVELYTTHGYRFSKTFSIGAGISTYSTETLNLYLITRFNLLHPTEKRSHYPFVALRGGFAWSTWTGEHWGDDKGPIIDLQLGWSFYTPEGKLRWSAYLSPGLYQFEFIPKAGLSLGF